MYDQKRDIGPDQTQWPHRIRGGYTVNSVESKGPNPEDGLRVRIAPVTGDDEPAVPEEVIDVDLVISATGYQRTAHLTILKETLPLLPLASAKAAAQVDAHGKSIDGWQVCCPDNNGATQTRTLEVNRNYSVKFDTNAVQPGSGLWLQGCCEGTHGVSHRFPPPLLPASPHTDFDCHTDPATHISQTLLTLCCS